MRLKSLSRLSNLLFILSERLNSFVLSRSVSPGDSVSPLINRDNTKKPDRGIVVTTFSGRFFSDCLPLIQELRHSGIDEPIFCVINGDWSGPFDHSLRQSFLRQLSDIKSCFPVCLGTPHGMSSLWNTGIRCSNFDLTVVLSDDLTVRKSGLRGAVDQLFESARSHGLVTLNGSFGHFAISRDCIRAIGWFDERFVAFGEEDGDYMWRYEEHFGRARLNLNLPGLHNRVSDTGFESFANNPDSKYSKFNTILLNKKYRFGSGSVRGIFDRPAERILSEVNSYPLDDWRETMIPVSYSTDEEEIEAIIIKNLGIK